MKKAACLILTLCLALIPAIALGEAVNPAFAPFEDVVSVKVVGSYNVNDATGLKPSNMYWNDFLLEHLNIKLDWIWEVPSDQYDQKLSMTLASGTYPDILKCGFNTFNYLHKAKALADLTDVWNTYACESIKESYADDAPFAQCTFDGELLAIPYGNETMTSMDVMHWRTDWLKTVGMEIPTTLDEMTAAIKAIHDADPDHNGEADTYALGFESSINNSQLSMYGIFEAFGAYPEAWIKKDDQIVRGTTQPEVKEALDYIRDLYAGGYIDPEYATLSYDQVKERLADGRYGGFVGKWYASDGGLCTDTMKNDVNATWGIGYVPGREEGTHAAPLMLENAVAAYNVVLVTAPEDAKIAAIKSLNAWEDRNWKRSVEEGGSGWDWYFDLYEPGSQEYEEIYARDWELRWSVPLNTWPTNATLTLYQKSTYDYAHGTTDPYVHSMGEQYHETWNKYAHYNREDMTDDVELDKWYWGQAMKLSRIDHEDGICTTHVIYDLLTSGTYTLNVFYGDETKTGVAAQSTLYDYANEYFHRYIMGMESPDSWDGFVDSYNAMGGTAWAEEVNTAYNDIH